MRKKITMEIVWLVCHANQIDDGMQHRGKHLTDTLWNGVTIATVSIINGILKAF